MDNKLLAKISNKSFYKKKLPKEEFKKFFDSIDHLIYKKGFNFKEQYLITRKIVEIFREKKVYWNAYYSYLKKIDDLIKMNLMDGKYLRIYPSPELQMNWMNSKKNL